MNFTVKDLEDRVLFTGTKQDCMHFIKRRKLNRQEITVNSIDDKPAYHTTSPVVEDVPPPKPFFKRLFSRE